MFLVHGSFSERSFSTTTSLCVDYGLQSEFLCETIGRWALIFHRAAFVRLIRSVVLVGRSVGREARWAPESMTVNALTRRRQTDQHRSMVIVVTGWPLDHTLSRQSVLRQSTNGRSSTCSRGHTSADRAMLTISVHQSSQSWQARPAIASTLLYTTLTLLSLRPSAVCCCCCCWHSVRFPSFLTSKPCKIDALATVYVHCLKKAYLSIIRILIARL